MNKQEARSIAVVGLGYVGLPIAVAFGKIAPVIGFDINKRKIEESIVQGKCHKMIWPLLKSDIHRSRQTSKQPSSLLLPFRLLSMKHCSRILPPYKNPQS